MRVSAVQNLKINISKSKTGDEHILSQRECLSSRLLKTRSSQKTSTCVAQAPCRPCTKSKSGCAAKSGSVLQKFLQSSESLLPPSRKSNHVNYRRTKVVNHNAPDQQRGNRCSANDSKKTDKNKKLSKTLKRFDSHLDFRNETLT